MVGEKAKVVTTLNRLAEEAMLQDIFKVDSVESYKTPYDLSTRYVLKKDKVVVCDISFDEFTPIEDRVTAIRVAMRIEHGNASEKQGGGTP